MMKWIACCSLLLVLCFQAAAQSPDERYVQIYNLIQQGDGLNQGGNHRQAAERYIEAQQALQQFQRVYPAWNPKVVNFRLGYLSDRLAALAKHLPLEPGAPVQPAPKVPVDPAELEDHVQSLTEQVQQLQSEKASLEAKLKEALSTRPSAADPAQLARAEDQIVILVKERDLLRVALEQERARPALASPPSEQPQPDASKLRQIERERDDLQNKLEHAHREIARMKSSRPAGDPNDSAAELARLQARLEVLEARPAPFTPEELARFKKPDAQIVMSEIKPAKSSRELPPGASPLMAQAERAFAARQFEEAEAKFLDVLRQDPNNVTVLANLASVQVAMNRLDEAEKYLKRALALDSQDAQSLTTLGLIKISQDDYDAALDALSLAARLDPENPETQNFLGVVLIDKGQRGPAEAAFRKAIQLYPDFTDAHYNLAVVYANQKPPFLELARWHYEKAVALGHPKNPEMEKVLAGN
jgi:tetratricopeptide (TPR) repeat protein